MMLFSSLFADAGAIFVDPGAGGIIGRPKLLRSLRVTLAACSTCIVLTVGQKLGATLCHDPRSAQYILVHPQSDTGRQFIRDWGTDPGKVVLNHLWVQKCSAAGKVLGADENWGNCTTHDDGMPIGSTEEEDVKSPLPTPRETPVDVRPSTLNDSSAKHAPSKTPVPSQPLPPASHAISPVVSDNQASHSITPPAPSDSSSNAPQVQQNTTPLPGPSAGSAAPSAPFYSQHMMHPDMMQQLFQQMVMNHMIQSNMMQHTMPDPRHPLYGPIVDSFSNHLGQISQTQPPNNGTQPLHSLASQYQDHQPDTSVSLSRSHSVESHIPNGFSPQKFSSSNTDQSPPPRSPTISSVRPSQTPNTASPVSLNIFTDPETGESLNFFVEVNMGFSTQRAVTTSQIKKHGGKLAHQKERADYCILSQKCKSFDTDLGEAVYYNVPAVNSSFVTDCVKANRLLDYSDYLFDIPAKLQNKRKGHQKSKQGNRLGTVKRTGGSTSTSTSPNKRMSMGGNDTPTKRRKIKDEFQNQPAPTSTTWDSNLRSPSPPPEHTRIMFTEGKYRYTLQEREYLKSYTEVLVKRDIDISNNAIAERLFAKMPHHSLRSWNQQIQKGFRFDIEAIRKRVGIAQRLGRNQASAVEPSAEAPLPAPTSPPPPAETPLIESGPPPQRDPFEEDLNAVVNFFALDGADEDEDEPDVIWAKLAYKVKCQTAVSWSDFHCQHHVEIQRRYELLAESNNDGA
ncbi:hypothetical protein EDD18DRAFT_28959 [Armillaria luteobubalina]|uniref:BRCT domain-containing protein n=1 Tax=Armillaria luteobubalina TaxID=153913 RepID=A0AA39V0S2_9AGAR|nr:hypothetical protein EDD18DRAFT_28959 [Armillaria luteobubalina]